MFSLKVETQQNMKTRTTFVTDESEKAEKLNDIVADHFKPRTVQQPPRALTRLDIESIMDWTVKREKIQLIKLMREVTGLGLREAKDIVDNYLPPNPLPQI